MFNYAGIKNTVNSVIDDLGQDVTVTIVTPSAYDTATGSAALSTAPVTTKGVLFDYGTRDIDGNLIKQGDKKLLVKPSISTAPKVNDKATIGSIVYTIISVKELNPAGTILLYVCNLRR